MDNPDNIRGIAGVVRAYAEVFRSLGNSAGYLLNLSVGTLSGLCDFFSFAFLPAVPAVLTAIVTTGVLFAFVMKASSFLFTLEGRLGYNEGRYPGRRLRIFQIVMWPLYFTVAFFLSFLLIPTYFAYAVALSGALGLGNISISLMLRFHAGIRSEQVLPPLITGAYLIATIPLYFAIAGMPGNIGVFSEFAAVLFNLSVSYLGTALYYLYGAMRSVRGILDEGK